MCWLKDIASVLLHGFSLPNGARGGNRRYGQVLSANCFRKDQPSRANSKVNAIL